MSGSGLTDRDYAVIDEMAAVIARVEEYDYEAVQYHLDAECDHWRSNE